jgi:hypothetical protein
LKKGPVGEIIFIAVIFIYIFLLLLLSFSYRPPARLMPLLIIIPTILLISVQILAFFIPRVQNLIDTYAGSGAVDLSTVKQDLGVNVPESGKQERDPKSEIYAVGSLLILGGLIYFIGFLAASLLFFFVFLRFFAKKGILFSLLLTGGMYIFIYGLFMVLLKVNLYKGILHLPF